MARPLNSKGPRRIRRDENNAIFGSKVRQLRNLHGYTVRQLGDMVYEVMPEDERPNSTVWAGLIETNKKVATPFEVWRLSQVFGVAADELIRPEKLNLKAISTAIASRTGSNAFDLFA